MEERYSRQMNCYNKVAGIGTCVDSVVTTYKQHHWSARFFSRFTDGKGRQENQLNYHSQNFSKRPVIFCNLLQYNFSFPCLSSAKHFILHNKDLISCDVEI